MSHTPFLENLSTDPVEQAIARKVMRILNDTTLDRAQRETQVRLAQRELVRDRRQREVRAAVQALVQDLRCHGLLHKGLVAAAWSLETPLQMV